MKFETNFDTKCYDLAEAFLQDIGVNAPQTINLLAQQIQDTIEDFLANEQAIATETAQLLDLHSPDERGV